MSIALDPSETRPVRPPAPARSPSRAGRVVLLTVLGSAGLVGLSAGAFSMLSGLAGPSPSNVRIGRVSADWPDLRDGVPALVSTARRPESAPVAVTVHEPVPVKAAVLPEAKGAELKGGEVKPVETKVAAPPPVAAKADPAPVDAPKVANLAPAPKPSRLPVIENAAPVPPAPVAARIERARTAPLVAPAPYETTRAKPGPEKTNPEKTFAAHPSSPPPAKPKPVVAQAKPATKPASQTEKVAAAQPAQAAEPESEETEVFGMKVPSLAPVGRKFAEGVEAIGDAVKRFPEQF